MPKTCAFAESCWRRASSCSWRGRAGRRAPPSCRRSAPCSRRAPAPAARASAPSAGTTTPERTGVHQRVLHPHAHRDHVLSGRHAGGPARLQRAAREPFRAPDRLLAQRSPRGRRAGSPALLTDPSPGPAPDPGWGRITALLARPGQSLQCPLDPRSPAPPLRFRGARRARAARMAASKGGAHGNLQHGRLVLPAPLVPFPRGHHLDRHPLLLQPGPDALPRQRPRRPGAQPGDPRPAAARPCGGSAGARCSPS